MKLPKLGYRPKEAAEAVGMGLRTVYRAIANKELPASRIGKSLVIKAASLEAWISK